MIRTLNAMALMIAFVLAAALYVAKNDVKHAQIRLNQLQAQVASTREAVQLLENEEAFLENPDRLAKLAKTHLGTAPLSQSAQMEADQVLQELTDEAKSMAEVAALVEPDQ